MAMESATSTSGKRRDAALVAGLSRHDETALEDLIELCGQHVYGKALQILHQPRLAEDITQDTMLVLWLNPTRFDSSRGSLRGFLVGVARFKAIDLVRKEETLRNKETLANEADTYFVAVAASDVVENEMVVRAALTDLSMAKREVIFLAFYKGLTYKEVAEVLGLPEGTVKTRIRDALIRLRVSLANLEPA